MIQDDNFNTDQKSESFHNLAYGIPTSREKHQW